MNDFLDWRSSVITIDANNGQILHVENEGLPDPNIDLDYKPKISKEKALQIFNNEVKELNATIEIVIIGIARFEKKGIVNLPIMTWQIIGNRKDKKMITAATMIIDCETGKVIAQNLE